MKKKDRLEAKREVLLQRTQEIFGISSDAAQQLLLTKSSQSLRLNTLSGGRDETIRVLLALGWKGEQFAWCNEGYAIEEGYEAIVGSELAQQGRLYIQNAASWLPVLALDARAGDKILDVCAAPGGKTSHIAALTENRASITANDNSKPRLGRLRANLTRLGVEGVTYTLYDASRLARHLDGRLFDKILLDAPCSGEGMMQFNRDADFASWSVSHIKRLQSLQKRIIMQSWQLLAPGGTLVYSTCTMAPEENEAVMDYLLRKREDCTVEKIGLDLPNRVPSITRWHERDFHSSIANTVRLVPSEQVEAFFVAKLTKSTVGY